MQSGYADVGNMYWIDRLFAFVRSRTAILKGTSAEAIALAVAVGLVLGVFPMYGVPTVLCTLAAIFLRLNHPAVQLVNQVSSPLQLALAFPLSRLGGWIFGAQGSWTVWRGAINAVEGWLCVCLPLGILVYFTLKYLLPRRLTGSAVGKTRPLPHAA